VLYQRAGEAHHDAVQRQIAVDSAVDQRIGPKAEFRGGARTNSAWVRNVMMRRLSAQEQQGCRDDDVRKSHNRDLCSLLDLKP
jgi:hypothetical protein